MSLECLQLVKIWKNIHRTLHPPTNKSQDRKRREDLDVGGLDKVGCSIRVQDLHYSESWGGSCSDCGHEWLQKVAKVARWSEFEGLKVRQ